MLINQKHAPLQRGRGRPRNEVKIEPSALDSWPAKSAVRDRIAVHISRRPDCAALKNDADKRHQLAALLADDLHAYASPIYIGQSTRLRRSGPKSKIEQIVFLAFVYLHLRQYGVTLGTRRWGQLKRQALLCWYDLLLECAHPMIVMKKDEPEPSDRTLEQSLRIVAVMDRERKLSR